MTDLILDETGGSFQCGDMKCVYYNFNFQIILHATRQVGEYQLTYRIFMLSNDRQGWSRRGTDVLCGEQSVYGPQRKLRTAVFPRLKNVAVQQVATNMVAQFQELATSQRLYYKFLHRRVQTELRKVQSQTENFLRLARVYQFKQQVIAALLERPDLDQLCEQHAPAIYDEPAYRTRSLRQLAEVVGVLPAEPPSQSPVVPA